MTLHERLYTLEDLHLRHSKPWTNLAGFLTNLPCYHPNHPGPNTKNNGYFWYGDDGQPRGGCY